MISCSGLLYLLPFTVPSQKTKTKNKNPACNDILVVMVKYECHFTVRTPRVFLVCHCCLVVVWGCGWGVGGQHTLGTVLIVTTNTSVHCNCKNLKTFLTLSTPVPQEKTTTSLQSIVIKNTSIHYKHLRSYLCLLRLPPPPLLVTPSL